MLTVGSFGGVTALQAATRCECSECSPRGWHAVETASFRILNFGTAPVSDETAEACEAMRGQLVKQWLGAGECNWSPKCDIVLHPTDAAYLREVGNGGRETLASSLVDRKRGQIVGRRIDIRATRPQWQSKALGHELTHVILADRFAQHPVPRWVDEGAALLSDPSEKQTAHLADLRNAIVRRTEYRLTELVSLANYPSAERWGTFYGQSMSLVQFLVDQGGREQFLRFVEVALERGYEPGLQEVYNIGIAELERRWKASLTMPAKAKLAVKDQVAKTVPVAVLPGESMAYASADR